MVKLTSKVLPAKPEKFNSKKQNGSGPKNFNLMEMGETDISFERTEFGDGDVTFYDRGLKPYHLNRVTSIIILILGLQMLSFLTCQILSCVI